MSTFLKTQSQEKALVPPFFIKSLGYSQNVRCLPNTASRMETALAAQTPPMHLSHSFALEHYQLKRNATEHGCDTSRCLEPRGKMDLTYSSAARTFNSLSSCMSCLELYFTD